MRNAGLSRNPAFQSPFLHNGKLYEADGVASLISPRPNPFDLENPTGQDFAPSVAYSPTNDRWYVSYTNRVSSSDYNVRGRFVLDSTEEKAPGQLGPGTLPIHQSRARPAPPRRRGTCAARTPPGS